MRDVLIKIGVSLSLIAACVTSNAQSTVGANESLAMAAPTLGNLRLSTSLSSVTQRPSFELGIVKPIDSIKSAIRDGTIESLAKDKLFWQQPRELHVYRHGLRKEIKVVYWKDGKYIKSALKELNRLCLDLHNGRATRMDKRLFDSLWFAQQVASQVGFIEPMEITSGYRTPSTNKALIADGAKAAKNSYHLQGKAIDFRIPNLDTRTLGKLMRAFNKGGVGTYHRSSGGWVHVDMGHIRHWRG